MPQTSKNLSFRRALFNGFMIVGGWLISGCTLPPPLASEPLGVQLIVKFRDTTLNPSQPAFLRELGRDAGAALVYVRPLSGQAHVLRVPAVEAGRVQRIIDNLTQRPDIEYVEPDRRVRPMPTNKNAPPWRDGHESK